MRELHGVVTARRANAGAIVTSSLFTRDAEQYQREVEYQIKLHDYAALRKWIAEFPLMGGEERTT